MNIKFYNNLLGFSSISVFKRYRPYSFFNNVVAKRNKFPAYTTALMLGVGISLTYVALFYETKAYSASIAYEPVQACVIARDVELTDALRSKFAQCLGWQSDNSTPICLGSYQPITVQPLAEPDEVRIYADNVSFYQNKRSTLRGHVEVQQTQRIVNAQTAYVYRDPKTNQINKIEFLGEVRYLEPDKMMIARRATINPQDKSAQTNDVLYRFNVDKKSALLPAWGRASLIQRFANKDYLLRQATYSTCAPKDKAWDIQAESITIDDANATGVARNARIRIHEVPVFYTPYFSFPTNNERKSGFLQPLVGYSNVGGFDLGLPYYWNMAPNYDFTFTPHLYSERGVMVSGNYRYLTTNSSGMITGDFLPNDKAYANFLNGNEANFPQLQDKTTNRWSWGVLNSTRLAPDLRLHVDMQQVSDDYYLEDFSTNWAIMTQRQILREADITYQSDNWIVKGMGQSYQTLHPINDTPVTNVYERLPQIMARGVYVDLPFQSQFTITGQYDQFFWPTESWQIPNNIIPEGPRFHANPIFSLPLIKPWGYVTPSAQVVGNYYEVQNNRGIPNAEYNRIIPRYSADSGLFFERNISLFGAAYTQTLEPRAFYLNVPYSNQTQIPVYDSGFMIFNMDQLFRTNRFSGFDRIGDANQLSYALTTRWLFEKTGAERANISIGQIKYFSDRQVTLCQSISGYCVDNPYTFGYLSPTADTSPIASRIVYNLSPIWSITGDYVWNPATKTTNNSDLNLHYQPQPDKIINFSYSYLVNGDITGFNNVQAANISFQMATVAFTWPLTEKWSTVGAYSHNITADYSMMTLAGLQYDSCCWAMRLLGGQTFKNLDRNSQPQYNNNVYLQILLKGLGSVANNDPGSILGTYIPGYNDEFRP